MRKNSNTKILDDTGHTTNTPKKQQKTKRSITLWLIAALLALALTALSGCDNTEARTILDKIPKASVIKPGETTQKEPSKNLCNGHKPPAGFACKALSDGGCRCAPANSKAASY